MRNYLDNFMCAFCNHFGLDTGDWDMDTFLDDWLTTQGGEKPFVCEKGIDVCLCPECIRHGESDNQIAKRKYQEWINQYFPNMIQATGYVPTFLDWLDKKITRQGDNK